MAINKTINKKTKSHAALRNCIEYVLREGKTHELLTFMTGPAPDELNWDSVYNAFLEEKKLWGKDSGRMYNHNIISFHQDEGITSEQALEFAKEFVDKWFPNHQCLVAVHTDKKHVHIHIVTNTVSYIDGSKLHNSRKDLAEMKALTNQMCVEKGFTLAEKGHHFDGSVREEYEITAWSEDTYNQLMKADSFVTDCMMAVIGARTVSLNRDDFIENMKSAGWDVNWSDSRKNITFINQEGNKVRDKRLSEIFNTDISKEALTYEFERNSNSTVATEEFEHGKSETERSDSRDDSYDTDAFIRELNAQERASEKEREDSYAERKSREDERARLARERELEAERRAREIEEYQREIAEQEQRDRDKASKRRRTFLDLGIGH